MKFKGNIELLGGGNSHILNLIPENGSGLPAATAAEAGRLFYNTADNTLNYNQNGAWVTFATGGNTGAIQTEIDAIETASGGIFDTDGTYDAAILDALGNVTASTSLANALTQIDTALSNAAGVDTLPELTDVTITTAADNDFIVATGGTGVAYVNLNGAAARTAMGVTIGTDVQAYDATLDGLALLAGTGMVVGTGSDTFVERVLAESTNNAITVTNGDGVAGNPTINIEAGLDSLSGITFAGDQMPYTTADNVFAATALTGFARGLLDDADEATARTTLGLASGGAGDIWLKTAGDTMAGGINMGASKITNLGAPTDALDAVTKQYADSIAAGLDPKNASHAATVADLGFTYLASAGTNDGVGDTLTATVNGLTTIDDVAYDTVGGRVLVKDQTTTLQNGIYTITVVGNGSNATELTRALDFDGSPANEVSEGAFTFVTDGTVNANSGWIVTGSAVIDGGDIVVGNNPILFTQASGAGTINAGTGLSKVGNVLNVNMGAGIKTLPGDEVGIDVVPSLAIQLTANDTSGQLTLVLDSTTLAQSATGLKVASGGITELELNSSVAGNGLVGGANAPLAVASAVGAAGTVGTLVITADAVGVALGSTATVAAPGNHIHTAAVVTYDPAGNSLVATDVQAAIEENAASIVVLEAFDHPTQAELDATQTGAGLNANGTYTPPTADYIGSATSLNNADDLLDAELKAANDRHIKAFYETGVLAAATSHIITHNTGQQYCNVMVIEDNGGSMEMIIPDGITFDNINQLTVTFTAATSVVVVVTGA